jgi:6-phosphogluconolactonase/glucosamine-6-phosphate isomerase/deaminase
MLIGIGGDGHLLSVFPGSAAFDSPDWALAIPAPTHIEPHVERVTCNPALIGVADAVLAVATGIAKATILGEVFGPVRDPRRWPAQLARRSGAIWILDPAAATHIER